MSRVSGKAPPSFYLLKAARTIPHRESRSFKDRLPPTLILHGEAMTRRGWLGNPAAVWMLLMLLCAPASGADWRDVRLDDPRLRLSGALSVAMEDGRLIARRFDPAVAEACRSTLRPDHAATTSGVALHLRSDNAAIRLTFAALPGIDRGQDYAWTCDGALAGMRGFRAGTATATIELERMEGQRDWTVAWPSWATVALVRVETAGGDLLTPSAARKRLLAIGDSISHGTGQGSSTALTWPWLCARRLDLELHNLAVGGSMTTPAVATVAAGIDADVITVLYGYNDWNREGDPDAFRIRYRSLIKGLAEAHPRACLVCIQPICTTKTVGASHARDVTIDHYRRVVSEVAAELSAGLPGIVVFDGSACTDPSDLSGGVHLSPQGAERLAEAVAGIIACARK